MPPTVRHRDIVPEPTERNIQAISDLEWAALQQRTKLERVSDFIATQAGRLWFLVFHAIWFVAWIIWNSRSSHLIRFDPFPYPALTTAVSLESIFLSLFILMSQSRAGKRADDRSHLDLQINLLAEHEATKILQLLTALCMHHHLKDADDPEVLELIRRTDPASVALKLGQKLPHDAISTPGSSADVERGQPRD